MTKKRAQPNLKAQGRYDVLPILSQEVKATHTKDLLRGDAVLKPVPNCDGI